MDDAAEFVGYIAKAAGDEEWEERTKDVGSTAKRLASGVQATGLPRLTQIIGEGVVSKVINWLGLGVSTNTSREKSLQSQWPDPPASEAYYGLAGEAVELISPHSEADPVALLIQFLTVFGNMVGRTPHFVAEADRHGANIFSVLVGVTAKGRKGSSLSQIRRAFLEIDPAWQDGCVQSGLSSGEGLIWAVRDPIVRRDPVKEKGRVVAYETVIADQGVEDKRLLDLETEFGSILRILGREGSTLSPTIRQAWDNGDLRILNKNSPAKASGAHISIIGHITRDELRRHLDSTEVANGFANRFLWICVRRSKLLPLGGHLSEIELTALSSRLQDAVKFAHTIREMRFGKIAKKLWCRMYPELSEGRPGLLGAVISRAEAQVLRLACIYALLDKSEFIGVQHLRAALALWRYSAASARSIFGDSLGDLIADELLQALRNDLNGLSRTQIRDVFARNRTVQEIDRALGTLLDCGLVRCERQQATGGRPAERWFATADVDNNNHAGR